MAESSTAAADDRRRAHEAARLRIARMQVAGGASLGQVLGQAAREAAHTLQVERVGVWLFVEGRSAIRCFHLYERSKDQHSEGAVLRAADFPSYFRALEERRELPAEDAREDPMTRELAKAYLEPLGIQSMLDAPLFREGRVAGVVCHEDTARRSWTAEDRAFAASVADMVSLQLEAAARHDAEARFQALGAHLAELNKMEALGRLAAGAAHDFRNVLAVVLGCADMIARSPDATAPIRESAQEILGAARRGTALTNELLSFGRDRPQAACVVNVADTVEAFAQMLRRALGRAHPLELRREGAASSVLIDPAQLERVVMNLALNARDAMPKGGPVVLTVGEARVEEGEVHGTYVVVEVGDTGVGMDESVQARIFEPFFTTKPESKGTGVGLAVVYAIVDRAGGFLHVESAPGRGTRVRVYLPRVAAGK
jgi:signal transduction histidine kinase